MEDEQINRHFTLVHPENLKSEYRKFINLILGILIFSILLTLVRGWTFHLLLDDFMATFFITFAAIKFIHLEDFVVTYRTYDLLSQKIRPWAYFYPFVEAILGFAYLLIYKSVSLNLITMLILGIGGYSVWRALYNNKRERRRFRCACLGTFIKLPLSTVSLVENGLMFVMAALMILI